MEIQHIINVNNLQNVLTKQNVINNEIIHVKW
jgi:hypothetical protein